MTLLTLQRSLWPKLLPLSSWSHSPSTADDTTPPPTSLLAALIFPLPFTLHSRSCTWFFASGFLHLPFHLHPQHLGSLDSFGKELCQTQGRCWQEALLPTPPPFWEGEVVHTEIQLFPSFMSWVSQDYHSSSLSSQTKTLPFIFLSLTI